MYRLFINDEEAELNQKTKVKISLLILDLQDISKRGIAISNNLNLPFTSKNNRLTGYPIRVSTNSRSFEDVQTYKLFSGNTILSEGTIIVRSADEVKGIKIQLTEGLSFWDSLQSRLLTDTDLFEDFYFINNTSNSNLKFKTSSVLLQGRSRGRRDGSSFGEYVFERPAIRYRRMIEKIVDQAGYSLDWGSVLDLTQVDNVGIMSNAQKFTVGDYQWLFEQVEISGGQIPLSSAQSIYSIPGNIVLNIDDIEINTYKTAIALKGFISSQFDGEMFVTYTNSSGETVTERTAIQKGDSTIAFKTDSIEQGSVAQVFCTVPVTLQEFRVYTVINEVDIFEVEGTTYTDLNNSIVNGRYMVCDYCLPEMSQKQFFKDLIKMFFLKVDVDEIAKTIRLAYFPDIISQNNVTDISNRTMKDGEINSGNLYGQLNTLTYSNDQDVNESEGSAYFSIKNETAKPVNNFLQVSGYSASKEVTFDGNVVVGLDIYGEETRVVIKDRIVFFSSYGAGFAFRMSGVSWGKLYSDSYVNFIAATSREREIKKEVILTNLDFLKIKDNPVVHIQEYSSNFIVTKFEGFEAGEYTSLRLLKIS